MDEVVSMSMKREMATSGLGLWEKPLIMVFHMKTLGFWICENSK